MNWSWAGGLILSDAAGQGLEQSTGRLASVWQPIALLKSKSNKQFVHVQDERGHSAHFALTHYRQISSPTSNPHFSSDSTPGPIESTPEPSLAAGDLPHTEQWQALRQQAYEEGLQAGRTQAESELRERMAQESNAKIEDERQQVQDLLQRIQQGIEQLQHNPSQQHEPLKRLALHLAEQLVCSELHVSAQAIDQLVQRCVDSLDVPASTQVLVELHPLDLAMLLPAMEGRSHVNWRLEADAQLSPGSVRVAANDAVVTDLIEHKLAHLAQQLLEQPSKWQANSAFSAQNLNKSSGRDAVQDVWAKEPVRNTSSPSPEPTRTAPPFALGPQDLELVPPPDTPPDAPPDGENHHEP